MTDLERLARSLEGVVFDGKILGDQFTVELDEAGAYAAVRAILTALREPSAAMIAAGMACEETDLASEFRAMIDHILEA